MTMPAPPRRSWSGPLFALALLILVVASFASLPLHLAALFTLDAAASVREFLAGFAPPELASGFLVKTALATAETLSMSALGTLLAVVAGLVLAIPAAGRFVRASPGWTSRRRGRSPFGRRGCRTGRQRGWRASVRCGRARCRRRPGRG